MKKSIAAFLGLALSVNALAECEIMPTNGLIICYVEEYVSPETDSAETAETATQGTIGKDEEDVKRWILEKPQQPVVHPDDNPN